MGRQAALLCICIFLLFQACRKEESSKLLYPVEETGDGILFSNLTSDTAYMEFALVRIGTAHLLVSGALNDGFATISGVLPLTLVPNQKMEILKQQFVFKTLDTLRNDDRLTGIGYNIRTYGQNDTVGVVNRFNQAF